MIRAVLFDLDGTLWDRDAAVERLVAAQYAAFPDLAAIPRETYVSRVLTLDAHGLGDKAAVYSQVVGEFGLGTALSSTLVAHFWASYATFSEPFPETISIPIMWRSPTSCCTTPQTRNWSFVNSVA